MTNFDLEQRSYNGSLYREFIKHLQAGLYVGVTNSSSSPGEDHRDIPFNVLFSGDSNVVPLSRWVPGFQINTKILSSGLFAEYDVRNNDHGLTKGAYFYGRVGSNDGLKINQARSGYGWTEGEIDVGGYVPVFSDKTSLALRSDTELRDPKGGSRYVRGLAERVQAGASNENTLVYFSIARGF
jgi:hypothetical protein